MSNNLMRTEPGGESQQYEGNLGYAEPHKKQAGQLGNAAPGTQTPDQAPKSASTGPNSQGVTPAEKIRYGQTIQESGGGAGRTDARGYADGAGEEVRGGDGEGEEEDAARQRRVQGYGGDADMDRTVGA